MDRRNRGSELEKLFARYAPMVRRRARAILGSEAAAEDAVQDVFIRVMKSKSRFRGESSPSTWLYQITTRHCLNELRGRERTETRDKDWSDSGNLPAAPAAPEPLIVLRQVLAMVPEQEAQVAVYYYLDQMSYSEIAPLMGVSKRTVGNILERFLLHARRVAGVQDYDAG